MPLGDPRQAYKQDNLKFELHGHKLHGRWALIRMKAKADKKEAWLLTLANIDTRLAIDNAPWKAYPASIQGLRSAMKTLGYAHGKT